MKRVLLVEPDYRSTYPPLGLMRISTFHKKMDDEVTFTRGRTQHIENGPWDRIYVSSLFTYELERTVRTALHYLPSLNSSGKLYIGGIGATLVPEYVKSRVKCQLVPGLLNRGNLLGRGTPAIEYLPPDYDAISGFQDRYCLTDAYFCRSTIGCVRKCGFCAVPQLEPKFQEHPTWINQILSAREIFGERQHLVLLDNNILAYKMLDRTISMIVEEGFGRGAKLKGRRRRVDFTQGIDIRFITKKVAKLLGKINLVPVRLAFDHLSLENRIRRAATALSSQGFAKFNNYMLYNYNDNPEDLYRRMEINVLLGQELGVEMTGFPMRYIPTNALRRGYVGADWKWRWLRGIQCILVATRGLISPNETFFRKAFGQSPDEFKEIISMPDDYIINRSLHENNGTHDWRRVYRRLPKQSRVEFLNALGAIHFAKDKTQAIRANSKFTNLLVHYYPNHF